MGLPFNLSFRQFEKVVSVSNFWMTEGEVEYSNEEKIPCITENMNLQVCFQSNENDARFYMEGLDILSSKDTEIDEDGVFIRQTEAYFTIFNSKTAETYSPFIPGMYLLKVICGNQTYYSGLRIKTKQMTGEEWEVMKAEIEQLIPGFVYDNERKGLFLKEEKGLKLELMDKRWYSIFQEIIAKPKHVIASVQSQRQSREERDNIGNRTRLGRPNRRGKEVTYNTIENQWLKLIIKRLADIISGWMEVGEDSQDLRQMRAFFQMLLQKTWLKEVEIKVLHVVPPTFLMDYRYKSVYELYRKIDGEGKATRDFCAKRTDLLYETWCYLQMIHALTSKELGFKIMNGWNNPYVQGLKSMEEGTTVVFTKGKLNVRLVYDQIIPYESRQTNESCPVYTSAQNNRPDTRMDMYYKDIYCGSVIIDYKYRPLKHVWDFGLLRSRKPNRVMIQLDSYKCQVRSNLIGGGARKYRRMNPITEVWAIFPRGDMTHWSGNALEEFGIRFIELKPNGGFEYLKESLLEGIKETIELFTEERIVK